MIYRYIFIILFLIIGGIFIYQDNIIKNPDEITVLVNKKYQLSDDFTPKDLKKISLEYANDNQYLTKEACFWFEKLSYDARKKDYKIIAVSTYRSYEYQEKLFKRYEKEKGLVHTLMYSAKPGHSEHQTGLAVDVMGSNNDYNLFEYSKEYNWMINNSYKYGFILRYPKDKKDITEFEFEPWHYRYVGRKAAKYLYENNLTLEQYKK